MAGLEQSEIDQIPEDVQNKINSFITARCEEYDGLKQKYEKFRVNSEQQYFDFEKQLISCRGKLETEGSQRAKLQEKLTELELKHEETTKKLHDLQETRTSFTTSEFEYKGTIQILENEKRDLSLLSKKKSKDIDRLNEEVKELQKKVTTANNEKCEAQARLGEIQSDLVSKEFREKRLQKEKEQLEKQVEWFNQQLTEKTNQLSSMRKEKTNNLLEVQAKLDEKTQELEHIQAVVDSLKKSAGEQTQRMESLIEKLKDERENQMQLEEQFRQELAVQKRLVDLYKASTEENDAKVTELTGAVEELRRLLKEASTSYTELKNSKAEEINHLEVTLTEKINTVSKLEEELKNANDLITALKKGAVTLSNQEVESLSPSAAATSKLLKSGMSLTQIYNEYVQATDALSEEREENRRLNSYLEQILQEIEEKAPLLKRQREDYETALTNLNQMTTQLDANMLECEKLRADADDMRRRFGHVQRESANYQQTSVDLGKQVQHLLKEIEELRGGRIVRENVNLSSNNVSSSSDMISEKLVTFRTIEELQQQNQRLMKVARDLSEKREQEENEATEQKTRELREQLDTYVTELEHLREARARQAEMIESIVRQRDMYRVLLLQDGSQPEVPPPVPMTSTPVHPSPQSKIAPQSPTNKKELEGARAALAELRSEFDAYKKDKAENDKVQSEMLEKMRQNVSELRVANTKLSTQLESATERYKIAQNNAAGFKKEADLLQERNLQASATILKHETAITNLKEELMTAQENVARWQVQVENLRKEKDLVSNSEMRHAMELESIRREQTSQQMLMASLQAIQNNQERAEFEMKTRHQNQIEAFEREAANLRRKLEASLEEKTRQATQWEDIVRNVHLEIKQEKDKQAVLQTKADNAILELETVKQELSTSEAKLAAAEIKIEKLSSRTDEDSSAASVIETEAIKDLKNQLAQNQILIKNLRQQIEAAKKHANQYKAIAEDVENNMKDQTKSMKEIQDACEKKLQEAKEAKDALANRLELLEKDHQAAMEENVRLSNEGQSLHEDLRKQLAVLQTELEEAITQKNLAVANNEVAQQDCKKQAEIAAEAQDKYQRELMLHAADVEGGAALKRQLEDLKEHLQQSEEETVIYEKQLQDAKTSWSEQERVYKQETELLEKRCEELTKQNAVLHEQMAKLSSQVVSIQQSASEQASGANTSFSDETGKTSDQLLEVIRFLRREKGITETKLEAMQTECKRVKQKLAHMQKQEAEATRILAEERQRAQISAETAANQVELMRKVSNMNVLTDSNKLLREERDQLLGSKQQLEAKIRQLESDIEPLQSQLREAQIQKESLSVEKESLQEEVNRWKNRTSALIEQSHKTDPEEQKRLQLEKENMRKHVAQAREESSKQKAEITKLNSSITSLQNEITSLKQENTKMGQEKENMRKLMMQLREENSKQKAEITKVNTSNSSLQTEVNNLKQESSKAKTEVNNLKQEGIKASQELTNVKKQLEEKTKECDEKGMTITRLKEIGRKYKQQAIKVSKELEDVKVKAADQETDKANMATSQQTISELRNTVTSLESQLTDSQNEVQAASKRAEQAVAETNLIKENLNTAKQDLNQTQERNTSLKTEVDTFEERVAEFEKKQSQLRSVLQTARTKMMTQKAQMERLETENKELKSLLNSKDDPDYVKKLKTQYESRISDLETKLEDARKSAALETERLQAENSDLQNKIQQLQKQLDNIQHKHSPPQQPKSARQTGSVTPSSTSSEPPKTANIKPMAPSTSTSRQAPAMTTPHSSTSVKATASIRPMAISPTTANLPPSGTPTATVMPTTVSQHEASTSEDNMPGPSGLQQASLASTAAGSSRIQIVEPQVAGEWNQDVSSSEGQGSEETATSIADTIQVVNPTPAAQPSTSTSGDGQTHTLGVALGKRTREEESTFQEDSESKRSRLGSQEHAIPTITVIDENQQVITQIQPQLSSVSTTSHSVQAKTGIATPSTAASMKVAPSTSTVTSTSDPKDNPTGQEKQMEERSQAEADKGHRSDDVIMVLSDEEDQEVKDDNADEEDEEDYEEEDDDEDDDDDDDDEEIDEADDTDDVVIIDIDEHQQQQQHQSHAPGGSGMSAGIARPPQAFQGHSERLSSVGRTQQLTPFMIGGPGNIFEEDDCTVPSTPTLSQPRRADGFAEALNSPAVAQRFVFGSVGDASNNPDLSQLESQRALGMDDTRMDLSSFDESTGRSAPATPTTMTILVPPETLEVSSQETISTIESSSMDPSEMFSTQSTVAQEPENVEEEDEALLEGDGDPDEEQEIDDKDQEDPGEESQAGADGSSKADLTKESSDGKQDKTDASGKPPIKKIIWDASQASSSASASTSQGGQVPPSNIPQQQQQQSPPAQQRQRATQRRAQGLRRGLPSRGRNQYWGSGQTRGSQFPPRGRSGRGFPHNY